MTQYDRHPDLKPDSDIPVVIVDLDSCLADTRHRRWLAPPPADRKILAAWKPYSMSCWGDAVIPGMRNLVKMLHETAIVFLLSARNDVAEQLTRTWLGDHQVPYDRLRLRADEEEEPDNPNEWKVNVVREWAHAGWNIELFIDDWAGTCRLIEERLSIPTLCPTFLAGDYKPGL